MVESFYEPTANLTILPAFHEYVFYGKHVNVRRFLDGAYETKRSRIYRRKGVIMRSCTVFDCKKIILGVETAGLRSYYFRTIDEIFIPAPGDNEVVPLYKQSNYYNIVFIEIYHYF